MLKGYLLLMLFSLTISQTATNGHFCGFTPHPINIQRNRNAEKTFPNADVPYTPYRIYYDYNKLDTQTYIAGIDYINSVKNLLKQAQDVYEKIITFQQRSHLVSFKGETCLKLTTSPIVQYPGVPADVIIIPALDPDLPTGALAAATACEFSNYPFLGIIKVSTKLPFKMGNGNEYFLSIFLHEMAHIFVFNASLYQDFVDPQGRPHAQVTIKKVINGKERTLLATPKVIEAARRHFGCDSIEGVELEDYGGSGTAGSHWEARVMLGDYMIGIAYEEMLFSDITMALFEDSGWYKMNYYTGGQFKFGRGEGCSFLNQKCVVNQQSISPKYFQTTPLKDMCLQGRLTKGRCELGQFNKDLPQEYRYFGNPRTGGFPAADFCPIALGVETETDRSITNCKTGYLDYALYGEVISGSSNCFLSTLVLKSEGSMGLEKAICYPFKCDFFRNTTLITVMRNEIECPTEGGVKTYEKYNGYIQCPKFNEICTTKRPCFGVTDCVEKKSTTSYHLTGEKIDSGSYRKVNDALIFFIIIALM